MSKRVLSAVSLCVAVLALGISVTAQRITRTEMRAAYLLHLMRFAEWPAGTPTPSPIVLCVVNDNDLADILEQLVRDPAVGEAAYLVRRTTVGPDLRSCQLLYAAHINADASAAILDTVRGLPVLTISDYDRFAEMGGIANFYVQGGALRFALNLEAARRVQLQLSSRLLSIGTVVKESDAVGR